jgi:hypothetical protein
VRLEMVELLELVCPDPLTAVAEALAVEDRPSARAVARQLLEHYGQRRGAHLRQRFDGARPSSHSSPDSWGSTRPAPCSSWRTAGWRSSSGPPHGEKDGPCRSSAVREADGTTIPDGVTVDLLAREAGAVRVVEPVHGRSRGRGRHVSSRGVFRRFRQASRGPGEFDTLWGPHIEVDGPPADDREVLDLGAAMTISRAPLSVRTISRTAVTSTCAS